MIGVLIVTHGNFGEELLKSAELIIGKQENVKTLSLNHGDDVEELYKNVQAHINLLDKGDGVLVLTDLFGGSPSNVTARNINKIHFESLTGVNLPMLIEALDSRVNNNLKGLANKAYKAGIDGIKNIRVQLQMIRSNL